MQLRGLAERTQESYVQVVKQLAEYYGKSPKSLVFPNARSLKTPLGILVFQNV